MVFSFRSLYLNETLWTEQQNCRINVWIVSILSKSTILGGQTDAAPGFKICEDFVNVFLK